MIAYAFSTLEKQMGIYECQQKKNDALAGIL
jgi:hypothetical protein